MHPHTIILEDSSLELVPKKFWTHESCRLFESRFGVPPRNQILDDNFHHSIIEKLPGKEKRGRPDVVHFALLDIMSTPAYWGNLIQPVIHTVDKDVIVVKDGVRLPRTQLRFNGVMSKILRKEFGSAERDLFSDEGTQETNELVKLLKPREVYCLSTQGILRKLPNYISGANGANTRSTCVWIVGGFARGHFTEDVKNLANEIISISDRQLPAHVVTARLSYDIERSMGH